MGHMKRQFSPTQASTYKWEQATVKTYINPVQIGDFMNYAKNLICYFLWSPAGWIDWVLVLIRGTPCILGDNQGAILNK